MSKNVARLYTSFQPEHYILDMDLDTVKNRIQGQVQISGKRSGRPSQRLTFHGNGLRVREAEIVRHDKKLGDVLVPVVRINHQHSLNEVRLHTADKLFGGVYTVTMRFESPIQESMHGTYRSEYQYDDSSQVLVSTQFESHHARETFPCIDEPEAKATFDLTLHTDGDQTVISNMPVASQRSTNGRMSTTFERTPRMSTYLLAYVVGDMQHKTTTTDSGVAVSVYASKAHNPEALDYAVETTRRSIEFFNSYYGVPYPLPKCDMVAIPDFSSAAMENWGLVTYREPFLLADPATTAQSSKELIALVIAHEISHQWFGNLVTMRWWNDLWLNESFANVMEYVAVDKLYPEWNLFDSFVAQEGLAAIRRDSITGVQSIKTEVHHPDEINALFDPSIVYAKGGRLINMLRYYIGEDSFRTGLTAYFQKHQYGNTTGDDLWAALSEASGMDVAAFMDPWLERSGFPVVSVTQSGNDLTVSQMHFQYDQSTVDHDRLWPLPLLSDNPEVPRLLSSRSAACQLAGQDYVILNRNAVGHYIVHYTDPQHRQWLAGQAANKQLNDVERLMLLSDSVLLARNGTDNLASTLRLLENYAQETSEPVWDIMSLVVADTRRFIDSDPQLDDAIKAAVRSMITIQYQRLGWDSLANESSHDTKLRATILGLGVYSEHPEIKATALEHFTAYRQDAGSVPSELRGIVFAAAVKFDADGAFNYLLNLEETTSDPNLKQELLGSLCATRSAERGAQLLARLKDDSKVRQHDVDHYLLMLMRNRENQSQAWDWMRQEWPWIETTFGGDKTYDSFPRYAASALNTRSRLAEYRAFFGPMADQPGLRLSIQLGIEDMSSRVAWIERDLAAVQDYFKNRR